MTSWRTWVNLVAIVGVSLLIVGVVLVRYAGGALFGDQYPVFVEMERAGGIVRGQEAAVLGQRVGLVQAARLTPRGVRLQLEIQGDEVVPRTALVQVMRRSPVGEQVINFIPVEPGYSPPAEGRIIPEQVDAVDGWKPAERGATIRPVATVLPIEIPRILEATTNLLDAVPLPDLGTVVEELDKAIGGRGELLRELNRRSADLNETLVAGIPEFERLIDSSDEVLATLDEHADELASSFTAAADVSEILARNRPTLDAIVTHGRRATDQFDRLVADNQANLSCLFGDLTAFNEMLAEPENLDDLGRLLDFNDDFWRAFDVQTQWDPTRNTFQWQRVRLLFTEEASGRPYEPHRPTPATRPGAACESPFGLGVQAVRQHTPQPPDPTSPGIDYAPLVEGAGEQPPREPPAAPGGDEHEHPLPATGGGGLLAFAPALLGGAYLIGRRR